MVHLKFQIYTQQPLFRGVGAIFPTISKSTVNYPNCQITFDTSKLFKSYLWWVGGTVLGHPVILVNRLYSETKTSNSLHYLYVDQPMIVLVAVFKIDDTEQNKHITPPLPLHLLFPTTCFPHRLHFPIAFTFPSSPLHLSLHCFHLPSASFSPPPALPYSVHYHSSIQEN